MFAAGAAPMLADTFGDQGRAELLPREGTAIPVQLIVYPEERRQRQLGLDTQVYYERTVTITSALETVKTIWQLQLDGTLYKIENVERIPAGWQLQLSRAEMRQIANPRHRSEQ
jgi:hypothetical protein